jgi:hypothetical protein
MCRDVEEAFHSGIRPSIEKAEGHDTPRGRHIGFTAFLLGL